MPTRRDFIKTCAAIGAASVASFGDESRTPARRFHLSVSIEGLEADPELPAVVRNAGVTDLWLAGFFYGHWFCPLDKIVSWRERLDKQGFTVRIINVPLGHPGDALGSTAGNFPLTPPKHWDVGTRPDGSTYAGTSLHPPATGENAAALRQLQDAGVRDVFLDDDFRLAQGPGVIGGCFCDEHRKRFCESHGYKEKEWAELLDCVANRRLTPILEQWVNFTCDDLRDCFRAQQTAAPDIRLGIMVMYLGAEKAGIRLTDYAKVPMRVGELMFDDNAFGTVKGKTDELFSALFHRQFVSSENAYSETTAYPSNKLSAENMAAKLVVSTIAGVGNTMFMSGITPFPRTHWDVLEPAIKRQGDLHQKVAGQQVKGPLKHYWGKASRYVGDDKPYSLFLAMGVPFEKVVEPPDTGWTFLSDADANVPLQKTGTTYIARSPGINNVRAVPEDLAELYALKHEVVANLTDTPYVIEDKPVVCTWYSSMGKVLLWNLAPQRESFTVKMGKLTRTVEVAALDAEIVKLGD